MGILGIFKKIGSGVAKGLDVAVDVVEHPAFAAGMTVVSVVFPVAILAKAIVVVKAADALADTIEGKQDEFAKQMREAYPDASTSQINALREIALQLEKGGEE